MPEYPDDADGAALTKVAEKSDMSKPMSVDFAVALGGYSDGWGTFGNGQ